MRELIISLDVGTSSAKAVLFDINGAELSSTEQNFPFHTPNPNWVEQNPDDIWNASLQVLKKIIQQNKSKGHILAISLATQGGSLIVFGKNNKPIYPCITWMDQRSAEVINDLRRVGVEQEIRRICGWSLDPGLPLPSILWLRKFKPDTFNQVRQWLSINDFLAYQLTGDFTTNPSMAGEMLLTDINMGNWSQEICDIAGVDISQLSPILPSQSIIGRTSKEVSQLIGIGEEILVINGGQDHSCEALAAGMTSSGQAFLACGTAWVINSVLEKPAIEAIPGTMNLNFHVIPDRWTVSQFLGGLGGCMEWFFKQCWQGYQDGTSKKRNEMIDAFNMALEKTRAGCGGLICIPLSGNRQFPDTFAQGSFIGLRMDHTVADMGRALMEGAVYELRWALESLNKTGMPIKKMFMVGGATRSPYWPQIVADVCGLEISTINFSHGPALGAAMLACLGLGIYQTVDDVIDVFKLSSKSRLPDLSKKEIYDHIFKSYQSLSQLLFISRKHE